MLLLRIARVLPSVSVYVGISEILSPGLSPLIKGKPVSQEDFKGRSTPFTRFCYFLFAKKKVTKEKLSLSRRVVFCRDRTRRTSFVNKADSAQT